MHDSSQGSSPSALAYRARTIIPMEGERPVRGTKRLMQPLRSIDNGLILTHNGHVVTIGKASQIRLPGDCELRDLGSVCVIPGVINCHAHLDLSILARRTEWQSGFTAWLESLIPLLPRGQYTDDELREATHRAVDSIVATGTHAVGNIAGSAADILADLDRYARTKGLTLRHFCEWFGFAPSPDTSIWPERVRKELEDDPTLQALASPAGHALYSTSAERLTAAHTSCRDSNQTFSLHLAESPEETLLLRDGRGPLLDLYRGPVLPRDWRAPGLSPLACALRLNLLDGGTLCVHGTQLDRQDAQVLSARDAMLCLCPRSNALLGVGEPDVPAFMDENVFLCLGTDGLTSNTDLDVMNEALYLRETQDIPANALIRMLTVNGARALNLPDAGRLEPMSAATVCVLPQELLHEIRWCR